MLSRNLLVKLLRDLPWISDPDNQILEAQGFDTITALLTSFNRVKFPVVILEDRSSGSVQLVEGPVDFFTQSIWIMEQLGGEDNESEIYRHAFHLGQRHILPILLNARSHGMCRELNRWDFRRVSYMKRWGGPNARGWEFVLSFSEDFSLLLNDEKPWPTGQR